MIKALFFDWGDTLSDSSVFMPDALRRAVLSMKSDLHDEEAEVLGRRIWNSTDWTALCGLHPQKAGEEAVAGFCKKLFAEYGIFASEPRLKELYDEFLRGLAESDSLFPDVLSSLQRLKKSGLRLGIISNNMIEFVTPCLDYLGLADFFDCVVISGELGISKPDREIFDHALALMNVKASEAAMVGDTPEMDVAGAASAGITSVWLRRIPKDARDSKPDYTINSMDELANIFI